MNVYLHMKDGSIVTVSETLNPTTIKPLSDAWVEVLDNSNMILVAVSSYNLSYISTY
jgi:hypothetical protein